MTGMHATVIIDYGSWRTRAANTLPSPLWNAFTKPT